jgi:hypothetical protein
MIRKIMFGVTLGVLAALSTISVASADQPVFFGPFMVSGSDEVFTDCGTFKVVSDWTQEISGARFVDHDGNLVRLHFDVSGVDTFRNSVTGKTFSQQYHNVVFRDVDANTVTNVGVVFNVTVPGHGAVLQSVGRIVFNRVTGELLFQAGKWDIISGDYSALCEALE